MSIYAILAHNKLLLLRYFSVCNCTNLFLSTMVAKKQQGNIWYSASRIPAHKARGYNAIPLILPIL